MSTVFNTRLGLKTQIILTVSLERAANMLKLQITGRVSTRFLLEVLQDPLNHATFLLRGVCAALLTAL